MILRQKKIHRKKKVFFKKKIIENSIRATQDAIVHSYRPRGHGERSWANIDFQRSQCKKITTKVLAEIVAPSILEISDKI